MFDFNDYERTPTLRELEKRYNVKFVDGRYPFGEHDRCCDTDPFVSDFISHRHRYHKMPMKDVMNELDEFMAEIFERNTKQNESLK